MFTITVYTENDKTWNPNILFDEYDDAKGYLEIKGYKEEQRWFKKKKTAWSGESKAIINRMEKYHKPN